MTYILSFIFSLILFPLKIAWNVTTWPFKALWRFLDGDYATPLPVRIVDFPDVETKEDFNPSNVSDLTLDDEIENWYVSRRDGEEVTGRDIHEMLADLLPEGKLNPNDWIDKKDHRNGGLNSAPYSDSDFKPPKYTKDDPHEFGILEYSTGPHGLVHNPRSKHFKSRRNEKVLGCDPAVEWWAEQYAKKAGLTEEEIEAAKKLRSLHSFLPSWFRSSQVSDVLDVSKSDSEHKEDDSDL